jgi:hypothetical protein
VHAKVAQYDLRRQGALRELRRDAGDEYLAAVSYGQEPRDTVERRTEKVAVALVRVTGVDSHPHAETINRAPILFDERALTAERGGDGGWRRRKDGTKRIANRLEDDAFVIRDIRAYQSVVACKCILHRIASGFPTLRAAFDVAKEESDRTAWERPLVSNHICVDGHWLFSAPQPRFR